MIGKIKLGNSHKELEKDPTTLAKLVTLLGCRVKQGRSYYTFVGLLSDGQTNIWLLLASKECLNDRIPGKRAPVLPRTVKIDLFHIKELAHEKETKSYKMYPDTPGAAKARIYKMRQWAEALGYHILA